MKQYVKNEIREKGWLCESVVIRAQRLFASFNLIAVTTKRCIVLPNLVARLLFSICAVVAGERLFVLFNFIVVQSNNRMPHGERVACLLVLFPPRKVSLKAFQCCVLSVVVA
jgi:hypothetical protein